MGKNFPSAKTISEAFPRLEKAEVKKIRAIMEAKQVDFHEEDNIFGTKQIFEHSWAVFYEGKRYELDHNHHVIAFKLFLINEILSSYTYTFGVESSTMRHNKTDYFITRHYTNSGDVYNAEISCEETQDWFGNSLQWRVDNFEWWVTRTEKKGYSSY